MSAVAQDKVTNWLQIFIKNLKHVFYIIVY